MDENFINETWNIKDISELPKWRFYWICNEHKNSIFIVLDGEWDETVWARFRNELNPFAVLIQLLTQTIPLLKSWKVSENMKNFVRKMCDNGIHKPFLWFLNLDIIKDYKSDICSFEEIHDWYKELLSLLNKYIVNSDNSEVPSEQDIQYYVDLLENAKKLSCELDEKLKNYHFINEVIDD